jgi:hypothetical protein
MARARRFVSKAQWRAMHARYGHRGWVKRWARRNKRSGTAYKALPQRRSAHKSRARF